ASAAWPPPGVSLRLDFEPPEGGPAGVSASMLYELYDGLPLLSKSLVVRNGGSRAVTLETFASEILAFVEAESAVNTPVAWARPNFHIESDMAFLADTPWTAAKTAFWMLDPTYTSQVNYRLQTPCLVESRPPLGPDEVIAPGATFESFRTYLLCFDSTDRERRGLALRRMYRTLAPWVTENPILMHLTSTDPAVVRQAIDQSAETGFEMVILSFGSGLDMENEDPAYRRVFKDLADYAHSRGIEIGGYSLLASRRVSDAVDVIDPRTGKPGGAAFGNSPCLGSPWGQDYFRKLKGFFEATGFDLLEHDGSYPGDVCASTAHPGHRGLADSQWTQWRMITDFYQWCRSRGIYLNVPDWYFLSGSNKSAMGYREVNWSLPRDRQVVLGRQNIFDGTWEKTPSMGWMFVPLVQYHGGGAAATIEPLDEHLEHYEGHLAQNFSAGVQACYRGLRLYDTERTRDVVKKWVDFYKSYRAILDSDIVHVRRPDGRDLDGILHVNPGLRTKGLAVVHNPTDREIARSWTLPLYYTGLVGRALIQEKDGTPSPHVLDRFSRTEVAVRLAPRSMTWFVITAADRPSGG
ncbi:MAG: alpha-galactosidase, partial [Candidatus Aminicenantes bacterium]|nr:alpha-galactosidase [Candidatus Aminicenantes bacterium]